MSGIKRTLEDWLKIEFADGREGCLFVATVNRAIAPDGEHSPLETTDAPVEMPVEMARKRRGKSDGVSGKTGPSWD